MEGPWPAATNWASSRSEQMWDDRRILRCRNASSLLLSRPINRQYAKDRAVRSSSGSAAPIDPARGSSGITATIPSVRSNDAVLARTCSSNQLACRNSIAIGHLRARHVAGRDIPYSGHLAGHVIQLELGIQGICLPSVVDRRLLLRPEILEVKIPMA